MTPTTKPTEKFIEQIRDEIKIFAYATKEEKMLYLMWKEVYKIQKQFKLSDVEIQSLGYSNIDYFADTMLEWKWM